MIIIFLKLYSENNFQGGLGLFFFIVCEEPLWCW